MSAAARAASRPESNFTLYRPCQYDVRWQERRTCRRRFATSGCRIVFHLALDAKRPCGDHLAYFPAIYNANVLRVRRCKACKPAECADEHSTRGLEICSLYSVTPAAFSTVDVRFFSRYLDAHTLQSFFICKYTRQSIARTESIVIVFAIMCRSTPSKPDSYTRYHKCTCKSR